MRRVSPMQMPVILFAAMAALAVATPVSAQPGPDDRSKVTLAMSPADCQRLLAYQPAPDVAYRPGEDVYHRPVAPADLPGGGQIQMPQSITIDLTLDLARRLGLRSGLGVLSGQANIGTITVTGNQVFFNGQPLQSQDQATLAAACRRRER